MKERVRSERLRELNVSRSLSVNSSVGLLIVMFATKAPLNFGVFVIFSIVSRVYGIIVQYGEPFPSGFPIHGKSQIAFTQYSNVPMLSLEEIKTGFPWLKMSTESVADREEATRRSIESRPPRYVFYYVPTDVVLQTAGTSKFHPEQEIPNSKLDAKNRNSINDLRHNHRIQAIPNHNNNNNDNNNNNNNNKVHQSQKLLERKTTISKNKDPDEKFVEPFQLKSKASWLMDEKQRHGGHRNHDDVYDEAGAQSRHREIGNIQNRIALTLPQNHKNIDEDRMIETQYLHAAETRNKPIYLYPKVPSPYMQPPMVKYEEKEFWVKNKRKLKRPTSEDPTINAKRLKNHRIVKQKKNKRINPESEKRLKNHDLMYNREHDPEEHKESSNINVETPRKRPKESSKESSANPALLSQDGDRIEFQVHGHEGPQTYIFGYDTGNGENRHFRLEERFRDGSVKGHYGYYDVNGKLKMVEYKAKPMEGYEEQHHTSNNPKSEKEDNDVREV